MFRIPYPAAMGPRIGIPPCLDAGGRLRAGRRTHYLDAAYAAALSEAGGVPLYLPAPADPASLCAGLDGLMLPGGDDFPPGVAYPPEVAFALAAPEQIAHDAALLRAVEQRGLPVLAICYGMQLLGRERGAALHAHLPIDLPEAGPHQLGDAGGRHPLFVEPGTLLAGILGDSPPPVNSRHHQALAEPGRGLRVSARADDGVIEAVERADPGTGPFLMGVQWHPETMQGPHRARLFAAFVEACASGGTARR